MYELRHYIQTKGHPLCFTGRSLHPGKRGQIAERIPKLLQRLAIDPERFIDCATDLMKQFGSAVGAAAISPNFAPSAR